MLTTLQNIVRYHAARIRLDLPWAGVFGKLTMSILMAGYVCVLFHTLSLIFLGGAHKMHIFLIYIAKSNNGTFLTGSLFLTGPFFDNKRIPCPPSRPRSLPLEDPQQLSVRRSSIMTPVEATSLPPKLSSRISVTSVIDWHGWGCVRTSACSACLPLPFAT